MIRVRDLDLHYGDAQALDQVSMDVRPGEVVAVVGANGAGKTSLIRTVAGMLKPSAGTIAFQDRPIAGRPSHYVCNLGLAQVAEGRQIFPNMTVRENLELGALIPRARQGRRTTWDRVMHTFPRLTERLDQYAGTLSGGEQQMLAIGRCLMGAPSAIMLDEPSLGLAPAMVQQMFEVIRSLNKDHGLAILLVEQNVVASLKLADRAYVMEGGHIAFEGLAKDMLHDDRVRKAYLGM